MYDQFIQSIGGHDILVTSTESENTRAPANNIPIRLVCEILQNASH